ncbi:MAG: PAS domain S-box protein [Magnetococcales bacterium]|nr:PAS domain S-box protein [Magnetococcales bacterium]
MIPSPGNPQLARFVLLVGIMAAVGILLSSISIVILYETSFEQNRLRLTELVKSRVGLIDAIANHTREQAIFQGIRSRRQMIEATMAQLREAHDKFIGFGETGEFAMARMEGREIVFTLKQRHSNHDKIARVPFDSESGEPMRQALMGRSGVLIGLDYRGVAVLAAHEPIPILGMGIVAKIDMAEIRWPFFKAGLVVAGIGMLVILAGASLFFRIATPMVQQLMETSALRQGRTALIEARLALEEKAVSLDNILRTATDLAILATDLDFRIKYFNPEAERLFDRAAATVLGHTVDAIHQELGVPPQRLAHGIGEVRRHGHHSFSIGQTINGEPRILDARVSAILDRENRTTGFLLMVRDVTDARKAHEAFVRSERKYRLLVESANDAILIADADSGIIVDANSKAGELLGRPVSEVIGMHQTALHPPHEIERYQQLFREHVQKGKGLLSGVFIVRRDGGEVPVEICAGVTDLGDGRMILGIFRDVTERHLFERSLQEERRKFQATFEQAAVGIAHLAPDGTFLLLNQRYCDILGYSRDELTARHFQELTLADERDQDRLRSREMIADRMTHYAAERRLLHKNGHSIWVMLSVSPIRDDQKNTVFFVSVIEDISERKDLEERLLTLNQDLERRVAERTRDLERSNQDLQQFASVASHDLQEPLRLVTGFVQLLEKRYRDQLDEQANRYIAYAVDGTHHMQKLINNLLTYARMGTRNDTFTDTDMNQAMDQALSHLTQWISESQATITRDPLPTLQADAPLMIQLFQNLLGNALKFRGEHPPVIHVTAEKNASQWIFSVTDNGIGIDSRHHERIFLIFQRLHSKARFEGTGIGLALCKRIIERHGGSIRVESTPNQGSTFLFSLPDHPSDDQGQRVA